MSFLVLVNGSPRCVIKSEHGIRQRDHLSSYLFILCVEVLSHLMTRAEIKWKIQGIKTSNRNPTVSHLLFPDDSLFFTLANAKSCTSIKHILNTYEEALCQAVNI